MNILDVMKKYMVTKGVDLSKLKTSGSIRDRFLHNYYKGKKQQLAVINQWERRIHQITNKQVNGKPLTKLEKEYLELDSYRFGKQQELKVNSTWIYSAKYVQTSKELILEMKIKKGTKRYTFYKVPKWVWSFLTTLPASAGKQWWDRNFGVLYSKNPQRWIRKKI